MTRAEAVERVPPAPPGGIAAHVGAGTGEGDVGPPPPLPGRRRAPRRRRARMTRDAGRRRVARRLATTAARASVRGRVLLEHDVRPERAAAEHGPRGTRRRRSAGARDVWLEARALGPRPSATRRRRRARRRRSRSRSPRTGQPASQRIDPSAASAPPPAPKPPHRRVGRRDVGVQRRGRSGGDPRGARVAAGRAGAARRSHAVVPLDVHVLGRPRRRRRGARGGGGRRSPRLGARLFRADRRPHEVGRAERAEHVAVPGGRRPSSRNEISCGPAPVRGALGGRCDVWLDVHGDVAPEHVGAPLHAGDAEAARLIG